MAERVCLVCGADIGHKRHDAKYCSPKCKTRAGRKAPEAAAVLELATDPPAPTYDSLAEQIRETLTELEAMNTISGMAALRVAQQIDRGGDSGSAVATLTKELSRLVTEAKFESAPKRRDAADEIASKVITKLQGLATA